jgi:hypothetical protein
MTSDNTTLAEDLGPRAAIHAYVAQVAEQQRRLGCVPLDGRWVSSETRASRLKGMKESSRTIFAEIILLFIAATAVSILLLRLTYYLAY